jgi:hypothetical protein
MNEIMLPINLRRYARLLTYIFCERKGHASFGLLSKAKSDPKYDSPHSPFSLSIELIPQHS